MIIGLVGAPSAGKSTFFRASTLAEAEIANYPFTTIKPNHGVGFVEVDCVDKEFDTQCDPRVGFCIEHHRFVPVDLMDVAGLVPGAHKGLGLGSQFLDDLRQAHVLIHVVDISGSTNEKGEPVDPLSHDPAKNIKFLETELDMWYLGILKKGWERFSRTLQQEKGEVHKALARQLSGLGVDEDMVKAAIDKIGLNPLVPATWTEQELESLAIFLRKETKPMIIACNKIDVPGAAKIFERVKNEFPEMLLVPCSAESELALREAAKAELIKYVPGSSTFEILDEGRLNDNQRKGLAFIKERLLDKYGSTGVQKVLDRAVFDLLGYIAIFPGGTGKLEDSQGRRLPDCFLLRAGSTALDFAFHLHTDLGKGFIRAIDVKTRRTVGKDHELKHRDVVEIIAR